MDIEAYIAGVIYWADCLADEARVILKDYGQETEASIASRLQVAPLPVAVERSVRYLIQARTGQEIPPSSREALG